MATSSVQDIDSFIQLQKQKLNRDRYTGQIPNSGYGYPPASNPNLEYNRQLDNYLNLPRRPSDPYVQYNNPPVQYPPQDQFVPRSQSPLLLAQQQQRESLPTHRITRQYKENDEGENFFNKFGSKYEVQKNKLKNELHQEYNQYLQKQNGQKSKNQLPVSDQFYATLPLQGLGATKENARTQRNNEYNMLKEKLESSEKRKSFEWWKDRNDQDVKPYSKHSGSQDNVSSIKNSPFAHDQRNKSQSNFDVISDRRLQLQNSPRGYDQNADLYRTRSANSFENLNRPPPIEAWRTPVPPVIPQAPISSVIDPSLADILRRPPVGLKSAVSVGPSTTRVQFNENVRYSEFPQDRVSFQPEPQRNFNDSYRYPSNQQLNNPVTSARDAPFNFSEDQNKDAKALKAREYQEELQRQVREKQLKKQKEKEEQEKLDKKMLIENAIYNPYGRSGGGAPIKDKDGNIVADLSQVRADPEQYSPRDLPPSQSVINSMVNSNNFGGRSNSNEMVNFLGKPQQQPQQQQFAFGQNSSRNSGSNDEPTFARGGNGIFGEGKSEDQKKKEEKYKAELQRQIEENNRFKAMEKEKLRIEEEKEQRRIEQELQKMKAELEEEERKKRLKEENEKKAAENAKRLVDERNKQDTKRPPPKPTNKKTPRKPTSTNQSTTELQPPYSPPPQPNQTEFRSNSPPLPTLAKKLNGGKAPPANNKTNNFNIDTENTTFSPPPPKPTVNNKNKPKSNATADYYITESRLNVSSPPNKKISSDLPDVPDIEERVPSTLVQDYDNKNYNEKNTKKPPLKKSIIKNNSSDNIIPTKPVMRKVASRPASQVSNSEVLAQLQNLKKHLNNELAEVENKFYNSNDRATVGQLTDLHHNILNVRTPPGDKTRREPSDYGFKTYRKEIETPPIKGGLEPRTYFRDNTILLGNNTNSNDIFTSDLQRQAHDRQLNRLNSLRYDNDPFRNEPLNDQLTAQNQLRLKKLRDLEDDSLSMNDPNDVLNKFISRNNRQPSAATIHDDTWLRQPA